MHERDLHAAAVPRRRRPRITCALGKPLPLDRRKPIAEFNQKGRESFLHHPPFPTPRDFKEANPCRVCAETASIGSGTPKPKPAASRKGHSSTASCSPSAASPTSKCAPASKSASSSSRACASSGPPQLPIPLSNTLGFTGRRGGKGGYTEWNVMPAWLTIEPSSSSMVCS